MNYNLLHKINSPKDFREFDISKLNILAADLRKFIIEAVATKGGHLGASLGVVELTIALHYVFNTPDDILVWDVGHQAYGHKILTGRKSVFDSNRQLTGISGFPKRDESNYDAFGVGHSSTSISALLGMAIASKIKDLNKHHIAVIGDASIASGMAFEAMNHAGSTEVNMLIILNDNAIGIDPSVGALKQHFLKLKKQLINHKNSIFESLNIQYLGTIDGHDMPKLVKVLKKVKSSKGLKLLHVTTIKGKGLKQAEENQVRYHSPGKFDKISGDFFQKKDSNFTKYQDVFGKTVLELAISNKKIVAITPAMVTGSSLVEMQQILPDRTFDVGIAEQHAVTLAAGMATQGLIPFCVIYSSFLQRAYDQIIHDVALQNLPVIFCIDRAGLVGEDGPTHHGVFDIAYLNCIPNIIIFAPRNECELRNILYTASTSINQPIAIRYPRGYGKMINWIQEFKKIKIGKGVCLNKGDKTAVLSIGTIADNVTEAIKLSKKNIAHFDMRFIKPIDEILLHQIAQNYTKLITIEDGVINGGFGSIVAKFMKKNNYTNNLTMLGIEDRFIEHGTVKELQKLCKIDVLNILEHL